MNIYILEGNFDRAKEIGAKILAQMNNSLVGSNQMNSNSTNSSLSNYDRNNNNSPFEFINELLNIWYVCW